MTPEFERANTVHASDRTTTLIGEYHSTQELKCINRNDTQIRKWKFTSVCPVYDIGKEDWNRSVANRCSRKIGALSVMPFLRGFLLRKEKLAESNVTFP
jgi:hypothetical protein